MSLRNRNFNKSFTSCRGSLQKSVFSSETTKPFVGPEKIVVVTKLANFELANRPTGQGIEKSLSLKHCKVTKLAAYDDID